MINKQYKNFYITIFCICTALLVVGAFYDWQITNFLYRPSATWAIVLAALGAFPIYLAFPLMSALLIFAKCKYKVLCRVLGAILLLGSCGALSLYAIHTFEEYNIEINKYLAIPIYAILSAIAIFFCIKALKSETRKKLFVLGRFSFVYLGLYSVVVGGLKTLFGRERYVDIIAGNESFTPWYAPDFFQGGSSFPSGHMAGACGILVFLLVFHIFTSQKKYKRVWFFVCFTYIAMVGFSRLIMGMHFLSDITASLIIMVALFMALTALFEKKCWLNTDA